MSSLTSLKGEHHTAQRLCSVCFAQCALLCTLSRGLNHLPYTVSHPLRVLTCMSSFDFAVTLCPEVYQVDFRFEHGEPGFHNSNNSHGLSKTEEGPWPSWLLTWASHLDFPSNRSFTHGSLTPALGYPTTARWEKPRFLLHNESQ